MIPQPSAGCSGKRQYGGKREADNVLKQIKVRDKWQANKGKLEVYRCSVCRMWHIGSNEIGTRTRIPYVRDRMGNLHHPDDS